MAPMKAMKSIMKVKASGSKDKRMKDDPLTPFMKQCAGIGKTMKAAAAKVKAKAKAKPTPSSSSKAVAGKKVKGTKGAITKGNLKKLGGNMSLGEKIHRLKENTKAQTINNTNLNIELPKYHKVHNQSINQSFNEYKICTICL